MSWEEPSPDLLMMMVCQRLKEYHLPLAYAGLDSHLSSHHGHLHLGPESQLPLAHAELLLLVRWPLLNISFASFFWVPVQSITLELELKRYYNMTYFSCITFLSLWSEGNVHFFLAAKTSGLGGRMLSLVGTEPRIRSCFFLSPIFQAKSFSKHVSLKCTEHKVAYLLTASSKSTRCCCTNFID